ncbi:hypothetical protein PYCCODRAFT_1476540 [Trametes coccinea BRFM310]|uniref:EthD domain-containing protein n=1 Tax=Trametes coccinea (strain BRFM310) TaxID=1353009 RepID=A0A1Y2ISB7_TRAC3|nr:hypothetical protein PYCCODRAFT_1476540 [Trametes coccinea BRFM310]
MARSQFRMTVLVKPKKGMSYEEFFDYWENMHAPLFSSMAIAKRNLRKYEQFNIDPEMTGVVRNKWGVGMGPVPPFAGIAQFEADTPEKILEIFDDEEYIKNVAPDGVNFVDRSAIQVVAGYYVTIFET